jgi:hypothetical protein
MVKPFLRRIAPGIQISHTRTIGVLWWRHCQKKPA